MFSRGFPVEGVPVAVGTRFHDKFSDVFARVGDRRYLGSRRHARIRSGHVARLADPEFLDNELRVYRFKVQHLDGIRFERKDVARGFLSGFDGGGLFDDAVAHDNAQSVFIRRERIHLVEAIAVGLYESVGPVHLHPCVVDACRQVDFPAYASRLFEDEPHAVGFPHLVGLDFPEDAGAPVDDFEGRLVHAEAVNADIAQGIRHEFFVVCGT